MAALAAEECTAAAQGATALPVAAVVVECAWAVEAVAMAASTEEAAAERNIRSTSPCRAAIFSTT